MAFPPDGARKLWSFLDLPGLAAYLTTEGGGAPELHYHNNSDGTPKLAQASTHQSPDTDASQSSLHHTIGAGANQASAGNHTHTIGGSSSSIGDYLFLR
jgi:hypothetical protein